MKKTFALVIISFFVTTACQKVEDTPLIKISTSYTQYGTPFNDMPEVDKMVFYEVNMRAFSQSGTLAGVTKRLDSIKMLGVNVIWLMPIHPIGKLNSVGQMGSPYSVQDYKAVNTELGTLEDLRTLVETAHSKKMAVIIDWVANHTAWDHPWISQNSNWYTQDANGNILIPSGTNWQDVADLNYNNTDMRNAMIDAMIYWVYNANIDGFRCDAADMVPSDFWAEAINELRTVSNHKLVFLAEGSSSAHFNSGFDLNFSWSFYSVLKSLFKGNGSALALETAHNNEYRSLPPGKHKLRFITNHDEQAWDQSPIALFNGASGSFAAYVLAATMGSTPLIYNGQEVGIANTIPFFSRQPINWNVNPHYFKQYQDFNTFVLANDVIRSGPFSGYSAGYVVEFTKNLQNKEVILV